MGSHSIPHSHSAHEPDCAACISLREMKQGFLAVRGWQDPTFVMDSNTRQLLACNSAFVEVVRADSVEMILRQNPADFHCHRLPPGDFSELCRQSREQLNQTGKLNGAEISFRGFDGTEYFTSLYARVSECEWPTAARERVVCNAAS